MAIVDCHFHVIGPPDAFPLLPGRSYTPAPASLAQWRATLGPLGVTHGVVVQPSVYGTDNRALLAALRAGEGRLVGVAAVDEQVTDDELDRLCSAGVRGVRMAHFEPGDARDRGGFVRFAAFEALAPRLRDRGLHLQLFTDSRLLPGIADRLARVGVPVVIDHMGRTPSALGADHAGMRAMVQLMAAGTLWVKLSGLANVSDQAPAFADVRPIHEALLAARPDRLLWGSDWPHTQPAGTRPRTDALLQLFRHWTPAAHQPAILWHNAAQFYGLAPPPGSDRFP